MSGNERNEKNGSPDWNYLMKKLTFSARAPRRRMSMGRGLSSCSMNSACKLVTLNIYIRILSRKPLECQMQEKHINEEPLELK